MEVKNNKIKRTTKKHSLAYELLQESKKKSQRDYIVILVLVIALFLSNIGWLIFFNQFEFTGNTTTLDSGNGIATFLENSESGDINYGKDY